MKKSERAIVDLAKQIYYLAYDYDDKNHQNSKVQEIFEWLYNGSIPVSANPVELAKDWLEYDNVSEEE